LRELIFRVDGKRQSAYATLRRIELVSMRRMGQETPASWGRRRFIYIVHGNQQPLTVEATPELLDRSREARLFHDSVSIASLQILHNYPDGLW
jgi:hypothetical protein